MTNAPRPLGRPNPSHRRPAALDRFWFGAAYYPEHWDDATKADDAELMAAAGFNVIRMAEFAWDLMEPKEGHFDFSLFDATIERHGRLGIKTILCTPTATPPRWLSLRHPDILRVNAEGVRMEHGSRQHACHMSPTFRAHSRRITKAMADHFKADPHVVGWQTDNEFHCHFSECHCPSCQDAFRAYLRAKFGDRIDALNRAWGTAFWSQSYGDFAEVATPRRYRPAVCSPSHELDYYRFIADGVARFQHEQVEILRSTQTNWFITHNTGAFSHLDQRGLLGRDLDVLGLDIYPMGADPQSRPSVSAYLLDRQRSHTGNFIVLEQQSGPGGQFAAMHATPEPDEMRQYTYLSIAHGADSLLYFRWRTCRFGAEEYWCGILDHDNVPRRRYREAAHIGNELKRIGPAIAGSSVHVDVAIAGCDQSAEDGHLPLSLGLPSPPDAGYNVHKIAMEHGFAVGYVHPADDLTGIAMLIVPHWEVFDPGLVEDLERFVDKGGTLVIGARTATRDLDNRVVGQTLPGCLRGLVGATVEEYGKQSRPLTITSDRGSVANEHWYEALKLDTGTYALATWQGRHLDGQPAISRRRHGAGSVVYVGTYFTENLMKWLLPILSDLAGVKPLWPVPAQVHAVLRESAQGKVWFFFNFSDEPCTIERTPTGTDLLTGKTAGGPLTLARHGVAAIQAG